MYTQCPECNSVFEVTAADLAVAGGFVRCGQCHVSFDALSSLSDSTESLQPPPAPSRAKAALESVRSRTGARAPDKTDGGPAGTALSAPEPRAAPAEPDEPDEVEAKASATGPEAAQSDQQAVLGEETVAGAEADEPETPQGETPAAADEPDEDEADVDEILLDEAYQPPVVDEDDEFYDADDLATDGELCDEDGLAADGELYDEDVLAADEELYDEDGLAADEEYDDGPVAADEASAGAESDSGDEQAADLPGRQRETAAAEEPAIAGAGDADRDTVDESALFSLPLPELKPLEPDEHGMLPEKLEGGAAAYDPSAQSSAAPASRPGATAIPQRPAARIRPNDAFDAQDARDLKDYLSAPVNRVANAAWFGGAMLMALLLIGQVVHRNRNDLVIHPRLGPVVRSLYETVGVELRPNWKINDFEVVGQARLFLMPLDDDEQATDEVSNAIRFVAIITNAAKMPQPAPMVRLTLRDRWGDATGARDFTPPEYLADRTMIGKLLEPGQRLRVVLNLYDFGGDAVGFDFDMCLPDDAGTLRCAHEDSG